MKIIRLLILSVLTFTLLVNFSAPVTYACSCAMPGPPTEEMARSGAVFTGKVIQIVDRNKTGLTFSSADPMEVVVAVDEIWKGIDESQVVVVTERSSASCGFEFEVNKEYIIYASKDDDQLRASLCSRTALLSAATDDLTELGEGEKPTVDVVIDTSKGPFSNSSIWLLIGGALVIVVGVVYVLRRRKS
ncbi:LPXTG cell wall anchor domain-containing protein [Chungangia koreensis]|uniref:LPXTG cell wall anchor domain-containing protein n=1 Tax=Chungangia koreensis TaxID=752657 RepID=A0ABV8X9C6_9LACT